MKSADPTDLDHTRHPFAAGGGLRPAAANLRDPFEALDDLMVAVEALCPAWPGRATFDKSNRFLL